MMRHSRQWLWALLLAITLREIAFGQASTSPSELPARRLNHARELLRGFDIDEQRLATFVDGQPLSSTEEETLWMILYRLPWFPLQAFTRWAQDAPPHSTLATLPAEHRADAMLLRGQATMVTRLDLPAETAKRLEFDHCFRVVVQLDSVPQAAVIFARKIPACWPVDEPLKEPVSALALFLKAGTLVEGNPELLFVADCIAWHPDAIDESRGISADHLYLAARGMDIGLFDDVRVGNRQYMETSERECFYQLLSTMGRLDAAGFRERVTAPVDLVALLQQTESQHGRFFQVRGTARRVLEVRVDDADVQERLGIDRYYQIDLFVPLKRQIIRAGDANGPDQRVFTSSYPVTVCVLRLPPGLPVSTDCREQVAVPAAFWKLWAYQSRFISAYDRNEVQVSPLFMGIEPRIVAAPLPTDSTARWLIAMAFLVVLGGIWWILWRSSKHDAKVEREVRRRLLVSPGRSLNDARITTRDDERS